MRALLNQLVPMADGVKLATDVWMPDGGGSHPTLLVRTPYYRAKPFGIAGRYVPEGYTVVVQDTQDISLLSSATMREALSRMLGQGFKSIPVVDENMHLIGEITMSEVEAATAEAEG